MFNHDHYANIIKSELEFRKKLNPNYSLRSFAMKLEISPSKLSEVINGKKGLSEQKARDIALKLNFSDVEKEFFVALVCSHSARSKAERRNAVEKLSAIREKVMKKEIPEEFFEMISNWHHFAILELLKLHNFNFSPEEVALKLGMNMETAKQAIERLVNLELIVHENGKYFSTDVNLKTTDGVGSSSLKKYHTEILEKAKDAIYAQDVKDRTLSAVTVAIDEELKAEVFKKVSQFRSELNQFIITNSNNRKLTKVYCFSSQFFELTKDLQ